MGEELRVLEGVVENYVMLVRAELDSRWKQWQLDLSEPELHEVVGALIARQVTLATQLALSPGIWNDHVAPVLLRCMTDAYITLAWILKDPLERCRKFILYGLGQHKLMIEHGREALKAEGKDPKQDGMLKRFEAWLDAQRFGFLTEVNVGSWSELSVREMAAEAECLDLYRYAYTPFSGAAHNMWHHINRFNLQVCENPLHRYHNVPVDPDLGLDPEYLYRAAKYLEKTFKLFDQSFSTEVTVPSAFEKLSADLAGIGSPDSPAKS